MKFTSLFQFTKKPDPKTPGKSESSETSKSFEPQSEQSPDKNGFRGVATQPTLDYLRQVELDDVLELMYPRLIVEQQNRLAECNQELEEIDRELARLYTSRDDVQGVMNINQPNS